MNEYEPLRQFVELARVLHFGRTARACHVSPSALSRSIQRLEQQLGEELIERGHHRVALTPAGETFLRHATAVLAEWERFEAERAGRAGGLNGSVRIYCTVTAAQSVAADLLARVRRTHPGIRIGLTTGYATDAIALLRRGDIDLSVAAVPDTLPGGIVSRHLATTPLVFVAPVAPGPIRDALDAPVVDWRALPLVLPAHGLAREYVDRWLLQRSLLPNVYAEIEGHEAILSLVALGCGVGVVPRLVLEKSALREQIAEVPVEPALEEIRLALCVRERALSNPVIAAVWGS